MIDKDKVTEISRCRVCGFDNLIEVLDFGELYVSNFVEDPNGYYLKSPTKLVLCKRCSLVQLKHSVSFDSMYKQYWYRSGLNKSMVKDLKDIVESLNDIVDLKDSDYVLDIGTNDGTLLSLYDRDDIVKIGFDPAQNLASEASRNCTYFVNDYFSSKVYREMFKKKAKVITAIAMFYDLEDPKSFLLELKSILDNDGVIVLQFTDLYSMLTLNAFDNICAEHIMYYSLNFLNNLCTELGLQIFEVRYNGVNGASIRLYITHSKRRARSKLFLEILMDEIEELKDLERCFYNLKAEIADIKIKLDSFFKEYTKVYGLGASTKGNTLLQVMGITNTNLIAIGEINSEKFGLYTVGTNIPIIPEKELFENNPEYIFVLPWHFIHMLIEKHKNYLKRGGKFIVPLPRLAIISADGLGKEKWTYL